jgi:type I restriction enzyme M protein
MNNKFCSQSDLRNESDVEQFFVIRLLADLGYKDSNILTKSTIPAYVIGKGAKRYSHIPDYQLQHAKIPLVIVEAKHPDEKIDKYITEAQDYAAVVNRGFIGRNPIEFVVATNGIITIVAKVDENKPLLTLSFGDFVSTNPKYEAFQKLLSLKVLKDAQAANTAASFEFRTPNLDELKGVFKQAHDLIRRKQKIGPKKAFYEFTKLLFVKMNEDRRIQEKVNAGGELGVNDFRFSVGAIDRNSGMDWINTLFTRERDELEELVAKGLKKRIFVSNEKINLMPSTSRAIVEMIENYNLRAVEDDINGKVFETFLEAAVRGKELGQFFTPRSVVKFMTKMANLQITRHDNGEFVPDSVIDGSCGTGGFLIFALSDLMNKIPESASNINALKKTIREDSLYGIDASEDDIVPITRMNMYLHGDGGSHIYLADTLDKTVAIEEGLNRELANERHELRELMANKKFDVVLTNPPFSMKYEKSKPDEKAILEQYKIAYLGGALSSSLKSNIMFMERYHDILRPGGKLLTVIDESVLNTEGSAGSMQLFRKWLREKYIIRAIVSLPRNTFINADAGVKTSVIYLTKRESLDEIQPPIFMAISNNIGHNDAGRVTSPMGDLENILKEFKKFESGHA